MFELGGLLDGERGGPVEAGGEEGGGEGMEVGDVGGVGGRGVELVVEGVVVEGHETKSSCSK